MKSAAPVLIASILVATACAARLTSGDHPPDATAVLWRSSTAASAARARPTAPVRFDRVDPVGDSPKFMITDAASRRWRVKLGPEVHAEIAAARIVATAGYFVDDVQYVEELRIDGMPARAGRQVGAQDGVVRAVQLELRDAAVDRGANWDFDANPFVGTREMDGLRVLMALVSNYDVRTPNNRVLVTRGAGGRREARYAVTDLGASFGRVDGMGGKRTKSDLDGYRRARFIERVDGGRVHFAYRITPHGWATVMFLLNPFYAAGQLRDQHAVRTVPVSAAKWIGATLATGDEQRWTAVFRDAGYDAAEAAGFAQALAARIRQLAAL